MDNDVQNPKYLGDAVYVALESGMLRLMTDSHIGTEARNTIWLEPRVYRALVDYVAGLSGWWGFEQ